MTTTELIKELRARAAVLGGGSEAAMLDEAADQLEDMRERLDITGTVMSDMQDELSKVHKRAILINGVSMLTVIVVVIWVLIR